MSKVVEKCQKWQHLNVVFEQLTKGAGLQLCSAKMDYSSSLVSSKKRKLKSAKNGGKVPKNSQNGNIRMVPLQH